MTKNWDEGYQDGREGRDNAKHSPNYCEGWEQGRRIWNLKQKALVQPADADEAINI